MNELLQKYNEYRSIVNYRFIYYLSDGSIIEYKLKQKDFPHLIGLHKLIDIPIIRKFNDRNNLKISSKYLISKIKSQSYLTDNDIKQSIYFPNIEKRYQFFTRDNLLTISYTDIVVDFDASLIGSTLCADYILFEYNNIEYNYLCIAEDRNKNRYIESFFVNPSDLYIRGQKTVKVRRVEIYDSNGKLYLEDDF